MKILSFGAGMQSTALALMSCENSLSLKKGQPMPHPDVPIYDLVIFCDLGMEPSWVMDQVMFTQDACEQVKISFKILDSPLHEDFMRNFGERRTVSIPWWTLRGDGHKIEVIAKYVRWEVLGYRKGQRLRPEDRKAHEMHMGFSYEEQKRCKESTNPMFVNHYPLVEMKLVRADNYAYIRDVWGLETRASACTFCPFHRNYFFRYLRENLPEEYAQLVMVDELLRDKTPKPPMDSDLFISRSRKRIKDLTPADCDDAECFVYR